MNKKQMLVLAAVAAGLAASPAMAKDAKAKGKKAAAEMKCEGGNACKGHSDCKGASHECKGHNECKGQGWVHTKDQAACDEAKAKAHGA
ncbi:MAG: hypothetical protein AB7P04_03600 [Bacteriovoracia bacterium]